MDLPTFSTETYQIIIVVLLVIIFVILYNNKKNENMNGGIFSLFEPGARQSDVSYHNTHGRVPNDYKWCAHKGGVCNFQGSQGIYATDHQGGVYLATFQGPVNCTEANFDAKTPIKNCGLKVNTGSNELYL
jgi:hypothetical protein